MRTTTKTGIEIGSMYVAPSLPPDEAITVEEYSRSDYIDIVLGAVCLLASIALVLIVLLEKTP
jgi:hypothetical protein